MATKRSRTDERNSAARDYLLAGRQPRLEDMNKSELLGACDKAGLRAHRGLAQGDLVRILEGDLSPPGSPLDGTRETMARFIELYWERVKYQMPDGCRGDCFGCGDLKVLDCFNDNRTHLFKTGK